MSNWDPETYPQLIHEEIPDYELLQQKVVEAASDFEVHTVLELGTGSGETARRLLDAHPAARLHGIDSSAEMLGAARTALHGREARLDVRRIEDPLPRGPFDLVVSALTVHHLRRADKADLFARIAEILEPGGRFVLADVVIPEDPRDAVTPIEAGYDFPDKVGDQLRWMTEAGFEARAFWTKRDLAVFVGRKR